MATNLLAWREKGNKFYTQKHLCSAALSEEALCSARHVQCPLSIASVKLATGRHSFFTTCIARRAEKCSQALNCWTGSWRHGNTSWPYWSWWQGSRGFQPCQDLIYWEKGGEEPWIATTLSKVYVPFDEKELEIKVESIPNTLSGSYFAERYGLVHDLPVLGGCSEFESIRFPTNTPHGGLTSHPQDLLKCVVFFQEWCSRLVLLNCCWFANHSSSSLCLDWFTWRVACSFTMVFP